MTRTVAAILVGIAFTAAPGLRAQGTTGVVQGVVTGPTGAPIEGASVIVVGTRVGGVTRTDGRYSVANVPAGTHELRIQRIGFARAQQTVTVAAGQTVTVDVSLKPTAVSLEQVVVVGYGTQAKRDVTGAITSVTNDEISTMPVARVEEALSGLVSGVQVQTTNAQPGSELRIRVRGSNSLSAGNDPLVVVDGVIGADLNQIDPNDIASVDVLKDASSEAIYGSRAANGVILVTTKRGAQGPMRFEYSGYAGMQSPSKHIPVLSADQFARLYMRNPNRDISVTFDTTASLPNTDWQDVAYRNAAPMAEHELRVSGTNGGTAMMFSAALLNQQGIVRRSDFDRGTLRFNLDQRLGSRARVGTRVNYSRTRNNQPRVNSGYGSGGGPVTMMALRFAPTIPVTDSLGNYSPALLPTQTMDNPVAIENLYQDLQTRDYLLGDLFGEYDLIPGLTLRSSLGYTSNNRVEDSYVSQLLFASLGQGQANIDNNQGVTWLSENTATLHRTHGPHDVTLLGGVTAQQTDNATSSEQGIGFTSDLLAYRRMNLAQLVTANSSGGRDRLLSGLGRLNYSFADRYLLTATLRSDGSSKFAANHKWATFPSAAVAWRLSEEPLFHRLLPGVNELKLRTSAGRTGVEAIGDYQSLASWSIGTPYTIGTTVYQNGARLNRIANPDLRWETTTQYDGGLDLVLFQNRLSFTADAYNKLTSDLLYGKEVPYYTGYASYTTNIGKVRNRGMEFEVDTRQALGNYEVRLGGNLSFNRNRVMDLGGDQEFFEDGVNGSLPTMRGSAIIRVGEPLGSYYGYVFEGMYQDSADVANSPSYPGATPGREKLKDISGPDGKPDGVIDSYDKTIIGNAQPKYILGQSGQVARGSLSLSYVLRAVEGLKVVNLNRQGMETPGASTNQLASVLDYWTPTNHSNTMTGLGIGPFSDMTSRWIEDGSFVRLQNMTLSWEVPQRYAGRVGLGDTRLYVSGQNLFTWTKYSWYDPEASSRGTSDLELGWDDSSYPGVRTFTLGWTVGF